jgi:DNA/RNA endonuclease G (NUC1)
MNRTPAAQANTFFLSNMSPQSPALNRGLWRYLEALVRDYAKEYGVVYVLTGSIFQDPVQTVASGRVGIPSRYYKTLLRVDGNGHVTATLSVYLPNLLEGLPLPPGTMGIQGQKISGAAADAFLAGHAVSIRELERLTGLDLLPTLDAEALKRAVASELWPRN